MSADDSRKRNIPAYAYLLPVIMLGLTMLAALVISSREARGMVKQYVPLQDAAMLVKHDLSLFHLSIEKHFFKNSKEGIDWKALQHAEFVSDAMVKGGADGENVYVPIKDPEFEKEAANLDTILDKVRSYAESMAGHEGDAAYIARAERDLDITLDGATGQADRVEDLLHKLIAGRLSKYDLMIKGQIATCLLLTIMAGSAILWYGGRQSRDIAALTASGERLGEKERELSSALGRVMLLSSAVEASSDVFQITDMAGSVMYSNKALEDVYGYSPEEFVGRRVAEMNADPGFAREVILPAIKDTGAWSGELVEIHRDGHTFPVWLTASLIKDESGGPVAIVGVIRDITEKKRAEDELKKYKFILDNAGEEFYMIDSSGRYSYMNNTAMNNLGYSPSELPGLNIVDINPSMDGKTWHEHFNMHKKGDIPPFEIVHVSKVGKTIPKEVKAVYLEVGGQEYICSFTRDITERKNLERYKSDFYAMITHDLKSPLTSILASAYLLTERAGHADGDDIALLNAIKNSGEKLVALVEDFLTFEKAESGRLVPHLMPSDVSEILSEIGGDLRAQADKKGLVLTMEPDDGMPLVPLDRKQVERAIRNLIGNALAYTPRGGLVNVRTSAVERGGVRYLEVSVSDTGPGIPQGELSKIFNKYYRSPKSAGTKGTGLGLAIVEAVATAHGGMAEVESEPGKGSTFRLLLPMQS